MRDFTLYRISETEDGTFGVFLADHNLPFALCLERKWLNNKPQESCVPPSEDYRCKRVISPTFGETFQIINVKDRSHILFHKGNYMYDSKGCVLVGERFDPVSKGYGITNSGEGFAEFMGRLKGVDEFRLRIKISSILEPIYKQVS